MLGIKRIVLSAEFCALSNGAIFNLGHPAKIAQNPEKTDFFRKIRKVFLGTIRDRDCAGPEKGCAELRIKFCVD